MATAVDLCLKLGHLDDALFLGAMAGGDVMEHVKSAYFQIKTGGGEHGINHYPSTPVWSQRFLPLVRALSNKDIESLIIKGDLKKWKEIFAIICSYAGEDSVSLLFRLLGDRLHVFEEHLKSSGAPHEEIKDVANGSVMAMIAASDSARLMELWQDTFSHDHAPMFKLLDRYKLSPHMNAAYSKKLLSIFEKVLVARKTSGVEHEKFTGPFNRLLLEYCRLLAANGRVELAYQMLVLGEDKMLSIVYPPVTVFKYRLYKSLPDASIYNEIPTVPFERVEMAAPRPQVPAKNSPLK